MIRMLLVLNRQGKTRLSKWYVPFDDSEKRKLESEIYRLITRRDRKFTNFVEFRTFKIVYRRYAGLYFIACVDITENELATLELIHRFVEILDKYFGSVCELDLVYNFHKCYHALDEVILAGEISETNERSILLRLNEMDGLE